jgi:two-component system NtrC family sensor kinase
MSDGRGSRFDVVLPMENGLRAESVSPRSIGEESAVVPEGARVLLIDDETMILKAYARMLGDTCDVVTVAGGREALELLRFDRNFDVVICDLMMPYVDGPMIYDEIRRNVPDLLPRMIFCSGGAFTARVRSFAGALGEQALLEKPVPPERSRLRLGLRAPRSTRRRPSRAPGCARDGQRPDRESPSSGAWTSP